MIELSLHIMDIVENSVRAGADVVAVSVDIDTAEDTLVIGIVDNGSGMNDAMIERALDPFVTTKPGKRTGLGLSLLREAARKTGGDLTIQSVPGAGTAVESRFGFSHIDRQPLGSLSELMICLLASHPGVEFQLSCAWDSREFSWDSTVIYDVFGNTPRTAPDVISFVRGQLSDVDTIGN
ncbi:ATP-binding protein [bacterium]|nr:ATP-binding protein [bacterium]